MKSRFFILIITLIFSTIFPYSVSAEGEVPKLDFSESMKLVYPSAYIATANDTVPEVADERIVRLQAYLASHNSPASEYAEVFVKVADIYEIDWRLVAAISGVESTFCKRIPYDSYNCWGWANGTVAFDNYPAAIRVVTSALRYKYYDRGLDTPEKISPVYAPPSKTWAGKVHFFMKKIDEYQLPQNPPLQQPV